MLIRKIIYVLIFILFSGMKAEAQQTSLYSQYVLNSFLINPAIAGAEGYSSLNLVAREQWIGLNDAPSIYGVSYNTLVQQNSFIRRKSSVRRKQKYGFTNGKVGLGAYVFKDSNGPLGRTGMRVTYAYHLYNKATKSQLSFGLSLTAYQLKFDEEKVILRDPDDNMWFSAREAIFIPDADAGIYYSAPDFFVGLSVDQLSESIIKFGDVAYDKYTLDRNYYLLGGYDFKINREIILAPSALLKYAENGAFQGDFSLKLYYDETFWGGLTYRTGNAIIILGGLSIDRYVFGYAFDISLSNVMKRSFGSHEFMFAVKWGDYKRVRRWLSR